MKIYICTNKFQKIAAKISAFSFKKFGFENIEILELERNELLMSKLNLSYLRNKKLTKFEYDLQSFTLLRFLPFERKNLENCLIIDPDVFAVKDPTSFLKNIISNNKFDIGCTVINSLFRSEVILLKNSNFSWSFKNVIDDLFNHKIDYNDLINFKSNKYFSNFFTLPIKMNNHDTIDNDTLLLHTSKRITQPWKEGLKIDFKKKEINSKYRIKQFIKKIFGFKYNKELFSKYYIQHSNTLVSDLVIRLFKNALDDEIISDEELKNCISNNYISQEFYKKILKLRN